MHNTNSNRDNTLPSKEQLILSTKRAFFIALGILVLIVLPAEYGVDPTYFGRLIGLTEMWRIKVSLQKEIDAQKERMIQTEQAKETNNISGDSNEVVLSETEVSIPVTTGSVEVKDTTPDSIANQEIKTDTLVIVIEPDQSTEIKLDMRQWQSVTYERAVDVGYLNYTAHWESNSWDGASYWEWKQEKSDSWQITAPFDGTHWWFFRNRYGQNVTITIKVKWEYQAFKQLF